jgi:hypothetical protein
MKVFLMVFVKRCFLEDLSGKNKSPRSASGGRAPLAVHQRLLIHSRGVSGVQPRRRK